MISLIAEPLTGLVDTAFIARLGSVSMASLGVGTIALSSIYWIFNFLGIATQTDVALASGRNDTTQLKEHVTLAITISVILGIVAAVVLTFASSGVSAALGASGQIQTGADDYFRVRLYGMPALLITVSGFGALRGMQEMKSPLWIALGLNLINVILDPAFIFGFGPIPAMGIEGAALASVIAQWIGAVATLYVVAKKIGFSHQVAWSRAGRLFRTGGHIFTRTALLTLFILITTRQATRMGADAGAVHQGIRQVWMFSVLFLDGFAVAGQSLIGFFVGRQQIQIARRVALLVCGWSVALGIAIGLSMLAVTPWVRAYLIPETAQHLFFLPWLAAILMQPVSALAFATDGIHWGTGDFRFLRNVTALATGICGVMLLYVGQGVENGLFWIWAITAIWIIIRAVFGMTRVWPGFGRAPLRLMQDA